MGQTHAGVCPVFRVASAISALSHPAVLCRKPLAGGSAISPAVLRPRRFLRSASRLAGRMQVLFFDAEPNHVFVVLIYRWYELGSSRDRGGWVEQVVTRRAGRTALSHGYVG